MIRPRLTAEMKDLICERIAGGEALTVMLEEPTMPSWDVVRKALIKDEAFQHDYEMARIAQADYFADKMLGYVEMAAKNPREANGYRVAAEILRWQAQVRSPRKYGDRLIQENQIHVSSDPGKVQQEIEKLTTELKAQLKLVK